MSKAGIVIERWKLPIFATHLKKAGYAFETAGGPKASTIVLTVETTDVNALGAVVTAALTEARRTGPK